MKLEDIPKIGQLLIDKRIELEMTRIELAIAVGMNPNYIYKLEREKYASASMRTILKVVDVLEQMELDLASHNASHLIP